MLSERCLARLLELPRPGHGAAGGPEEVLSLTLRQGDETAAVPSWAVCAGSKDWVCHRTPSG